MVTIVHTTNSYNLYLLYTKKVFQSMLSLESYEVTVLWPIDKLTFTFSNSIPKVNKFCKRIFLLERDEMTTLSPYESYTFTFYSKFSNWAPFVKEVLCPNAQFSKWQNYNLLMKLDIKFHFLGDILK